MKVILVPGLIIMLAIARPGAAQRVQVAPADARSHIVIADSMEQGTRLLVSGRVIDESGRAIPGASLYVYQTDARGEYVPGQRGGSDRPRLFGFLRSDAEGRYSFSTIKPGSYPESRNPAHIHFEVSTTGNHQRVYEIVFAGDPYINERFQAIARDPFGGVAIVTAQSSRNGSLRVTHDVRLRARTYNIVSGSQASYAVDEVFLNENNRLFTAIGVTTGVTGAVTLDPLQPATGRVDSVIVDLRELTSDSPRRDRALREKYLDTRSFPFARLRNGILRGLPARLQAGAVFHFTVAGELNVHGVTRRSIWQGQARLVGDTLRGSATTRVKMSDFGVEVPRLLSLRSADDVRLEVSFVAVAETTL